MYSVAITRIKFLSVKFTVLILKFQNKDMVEFFKKGLKPLRMTEAHDPSTQGLGQKGLKEEAILGY